MGSTGIAVVQKQCRNKNTHKAADYGYYVQKKWKTCSIKEDWNWQRKHKGKDYCLRSISYNDIVRYLTISANKSSWENNCQYYIIWENLRINYSWCICNNLGNSEFRQSVQHGALHTSIFRGDQQIWGRGGCGTIISSWQWKKRRGGGEEVITLKKRSIIPGKMSWQANVCVFSDVFEKYFHFQSRTGERKTMKIENKLKTNIWKTLAEELSVDGKDRNRITDNWI